MGMGGTRNKKLLRAHLSVTVHSLHNNRHYTS